MRVLHLVDPRHAPWSVLAGVRGVMASEPSIEHVVVLLGGSTAGMRAETAGLGWRVRIAPPLRDPMLARSVLSRWVRTAGPFDVIHAWSSDAAALATVVCPETPLVADVFESPTRAVAGGGVLAVAGAVRFVDAWCAESWGMSGGGGVAVGAPDAPPTDASVGDAIRTELGITPGMCVLVANSEPGRTVDAMLAMYIVGVLSERGLSATVIVPPDATGLDRAHRFAACHMDRWCARMSDRPAWELLSIADGVVVAERPPCDGRRRSESILTTALWAGRLGLPVIAPRTERMEAVLGEGVEWVEPGDRLGFVRAAARVLEARRGERGVGAPAGAPGPACPDLYRLCGLVNA